MSFQRASVDAQRRCALVTGVTGQDGSYLAELLLDKGYDVHGLVRRGSANTCGRLQHLVGEVNGLGPQLCLHYGDSTDADRVTSLVRSIGPDEIYNLAAQSHVHVSFANPVYTMHVTALGALNLLEAARHLRDETGRDVRFYQAGSSEMFGGDPRTAPQDESTGFHPKSPYACSKVYAHHQAVNYREAYGLFACNGILFNHESPRRGEMFVTRKISLAAARIKAGVQDRLCLGNLEAERDWGYAPEYVEAMWRMLQHEQADDYVIATGKSNSVKDFVEAAFNRLGLAWQDYVDFDPALLRPAEVSRLVGNSAKARDILGWKPQTSFEELVGVMVNADWATLAGLSRETMDKVEVVQSSSCHNETAGRINA